MAKECKVLSKNGIEKLVDIIRERSFGRLTEKQVEDIAIQTIEIKKKIAESRIPNNFEKAIEYIEKLPLTVEEKVDLATKVETFIEERKAVEKNNEKKESFLSELFTGSVNILENSNDQIKKNKVIDGFKKLFGKSQNEKQEAVGLGEVEDPTGALAFALSENPTNYFNWNTKSFLELQSGYKVDIDLDESNRLVKDAEVYMKYSGEPSADIQLYKEVTTYNLVREEDKFGSNTGNWKRQNVKKEYVRVEDYSPKEEPVKKDETETPEQFAARKLNNLITEHADTISTLDSEISQKHSSIEGSARRLSKIKGLDKLRVFDFKNSKLSEEEKAIVQSREEERASKFREEIAELNKKIEQENAALEKLIQQRSDKNLKYRIKIAEEEEYLLKGLASNAKELKLVNEFPNFMHEQERLSYEDFKHKYSKEEIDFFDKLSNALITKENDVVSNKGGEIEEVSKSNYFNAGTIAKQGEFLEPTYKKAYSPSRINKTKDALGLVDFYKNIPGYSMDKENILSTIMGDKSTKELSRTIGIGEVPEDLTTLVEQKYDRNPLIDFVEDLRNKQIEEERNKNNLKEGTEEFKTTDDVTTLGRSINGVKEFAKTQKEIFKKVKYYSSFKEEAFASDLSVTNVLSETEFKNVVEKAKTSAKEILESSISKNNNYISYAEAAERAERAVENTAKAQKRIIDEAAKSVPKLEKSHIEKTKKWLDYTINLNESDITVKNKDVIKLFKEEILKDPTYTTTDKDGKLSITPKALDDIEVISDNVWKRQQSDIFANTVDAEIYEVEYLDESLDNATIDKIVEDSDGETVQKISSEIKKIYSMNEIVQRINNAKANIYTNLKLFSDLYAKTKNVEKVRTITKDEMKEYGKRLVDSDIKSKSQILNANITIANDFFKDWIKEKGYEAGSYNAMNDAEKTELVESLSKLIPGSYPVLDTTLYSKTYLDDLRKKNIADGKTIEISFDNKARETATIYRHDEATDRMIEEESSFQVPGIRIVSVKDWSVGDKKYISEKIISRFKGESGKTDNISNLQKHFIDEYFSKHKKEMEALQSLESKPKTEKVGNKEFSLGMKKVETKSQKEARIKEEKAKMDKLESLLSKDSKETSTTSKNSVMIDALAEKIIFKKSAEYLHEEFQKSMRTQKDAYEHIRKLKDSINKKVLNNIKTMRPDLIKKTKIIDPNGNEKDQKLIATKTAAFNSIVKEFSMFKFNKDQALNNRIRKAKINKTEKAFTNIRLASNKETLRISLENDGFWAGGEAAGIFFEITPKGDGNYEIKRGFKGADGKDSFEANSNENKEALDIIKKITKSISKGELSPKEMIKYNNAAMLKSAQIKRARQLIERKSIDHMLQKAKINFPKNPRDAFINYFLENTRLNAEDRWASLVGEGSIKSTAEIVKDRKAKLKEIAKKIGNWEIEKNRIGSKLEDLKEQYNEYSSLDRQIKKLDNEITSINRKEKTVKYADPLDNGAIKEEVVPLSEKDLKRIEEIKDKRATLLEKLDKKAYDLLPKELKDLEAKKSEMSDESLDSLKEKYIELANVKNAPSEEQRKESFIKNEVDNANKLLDSIKSVKGMENTDLFARSIKKVSLALSDSVNDISSMFKNHDESFILAVAKAISESPVDAESKATKALLWNSKSVWFEDKLVKDKTWIDGRSLEYKKALKENKAKIEDLNDEILNSATYSKDDAKVKELNSKIKSLEEENKMIRQLINTIYSVGTSNGEKALIEILNSKVDKGNFITSEKSELPLSALPKDMVDRELKYYESVGDKIRDFKSMKDELDKVKDKAIETENLVQSDSGYKGEFDKTAELGEDQELKPTPDKAVTNIRESGRDETLEVLEDIRPSDAYEISNALNYINLFRKINYGQKAIEEYELRDKTLDTNEGLKDKDMSRLSGILSTNNNPEITSQLLDLNQRVNSMVGGKTDKTPEEQKVESLSNAETDETGNLVDHETNEEQQSQC